MVREAVQIWYDLIRLRDERMSVDWDCSIKIEALEG
jgi:hypothetical protein